MSEKQQLQTMIDEGQLLNLNQQTAMKVYDTQVNGEALAFFQIIGYSDKLDCHITASYGQTMQGARKMGEYLISLADKYDPQPKVEVIEPAKAETKKTTKKEKA